MQHREDMEGNAEDALWEEGLDSKSFSVNAGAAVAATVAVFVAPAFWSVSKELAIWVLSTVVVPDLQFLRTLEDVAPFYPSFLSADALPSGRSFYEAVFPFLSAITFLYALRRVRTYAIRALEATEDGYRLFEDVEIGRPRGEAIEASLLVFRHLVLLYFLWQILDPLVSDHVVLDSLVNTVLFLFALVLIGRWIGRVARAAYREEVNNPQGAKGVFGWFKVVPATLAAVSALVTLQHAAHLLF